MLNMLFNRQTERSKSRGSPAQVTLSPQVFTKVYICSSAKLSWQMTSGRGGSQLWKCLYLARNVTKGNNVLSQSTLIDLPTISPVPPLTRETPANKAALPLKARALLTAKSPIAACGPHTPTETHTLTSHLTATSYGLSASLTYVISCMTPGSDTKGLHLKFTFKCWKTVAYVNVSSGCLCMSVVWVEPSFTAMPLVVCHHMIPHWLLTIGQGW